MSWAAMLIVCNSVMRGPAGMTGLGTLPHSVLEIIFRNCHLEDQWALAQTSHNFRELWGTLVVYRLWDDLDSPPSVTAHTLWLRVQARRTAHALARRFCAEMYQKPLESSVFNEDFIYHTSVTGHFGQKELQLILYPGSPYIQLLSEYFTKRIIHLLSPAQAAFSDLDDSYIPGGTAVFMLTFQLHHSRQTGFTAEELDILGDFIAPLPNAYAPWVLEPENFNRHVICAPAWQLISPAGQVLACYWDIASRIHISRVADLSELCEGVLRS